MATDLAQTELDQSVLIKQPVIETDVTGTDLPEVAQPFEGLSEEETLAAMKADLVDKGFDWTVLLWIGTIHIGALAAPFFITPGAVILAIALAWLTGSIGVCMGYHRHLTHHSFATYRPVTWLLALIGAFSGEGSSLRWVANHRKHHMFSDKPGDPHTPRDGGVWSHVFWMFPDLGRNGEKDLIDRYAPDLAKDPVLVFLHRTFLWQNLLLGGAIMGLGYAVGGDLYTAVAYVAWAVFVRMVYVLHITWFVNSASHIWGYRNYETSDQSRNLWWVGLTAFGEGWHNNHHAYQRLALHGHKWWEFDMTYRAIWLMEKVGLAWNVVKTIPKNAKPA